MIKRTTGTRVMETTRNGKSRRDRMIFYLCDYMIIILGLIRSCSLAASSISKWTLRQNREPV